jgi:hypothetical protein
MPDMKHPGPWTPWRQFGENDDIGGVADANGKLVFSASGAGELQFSDREAERLALAAPESFALVVEMLTSIMPEMSGFPYDDVLIKDFRARCRRLVALVLAQPPKAQPVYPFPFPAKEEQAATPAARPSYEELVAGLDALAKEKEGDERELQAIDHYEETDELKAARALLARIEQEPHV